MSKNIIYHLNKFYMGKILIYSATSTYFANVIIFLEDMEENKVRCFIETHCGVHSHTI